MRSVHALCSTVAFALLAASPVWGTEDYPVEVSQPGGDWIITTTYFTSASGYPVEVSLTTEANQLARFGTTWNANAASEHGIRVKVVPGPDHAPIQTYDEMRGFGMRGDTLDVVLDLTSPTPTTFPPGSVDPDLMARAMQTVFDRLVGQTFSCVLLNARRRWPEVKFVSLDVLGPDQYSRFKGVHSLETVPQLGGVSHWTASYLLKR